MQLRPLVIPFYDLAELKDRLIRELRPYQAVHSLQVFQRQGKPYELVVHLASGRMRWESLELVWEAIESGIVLPARRDDSTPVREGLIKREHTFAVPMPDGCRHLVLTFAFYKREPVGDLI